MFSSAYLQLLQCFILLLLLIIIIIIIIIVIITIIILVIAIKISSKNCNNSEEVLNTKPIRNRRDHVPGVGFMDHFCRKCFFIGE